MIDARTPVDPLPVPGAPAGPATARPADVAQPSSGIWRDTLRNILRQRSAVLGLLILGFLVFVAVFADVIATHDPNQSLLGHEAGVERRAPPCIHLLGCPADKPQHIFGTDGNFRDVFSRVVHGARTSLTVGFAAIGIAILLGATIGAVAGYLSGWADNGLMRFMDVLLAFPSLLLAIAIVTAAGRSMTNALLAIGIVSIPIYARIIRSSVIETKTRDFVTASRSLGDSNIGILTRRILPNSITPLVVAGTLGVGAAVLEIAALSFVGVTGDLSAPEWGSMIGLEKNQLFNAPWIILAPGLAITLTVLGFSLLGDGLRDALDPRLNR
jgi:ABC-type dipeptide/oligopeptide/nickel transport system permease subunit